MQRNIKEIMESSLNRLLQKAKADTDVLAVILFGSAARNESDSLSDVDVCILLNKNYDPLVMSHKRLEYLSVSDFDVSIFQQLPLYIKHRVAKEGKVLFCRDEERLYELVFKTIKEFEDFKPIYHEYLKSIVHA
jgi:hypothetical protein